MVVSAGTDPAIRELIRVTRTGPDDYTVEDIADVRVAPLDVDAERIRSRQAEWPRAGSADGLLAQTIAGACERFESIESADLAPLLERIGDARVVLLGEATHGTSEFYRMRERISRELIERKGFDFIAIEGDWPDAARIDRYVRAQLELTHGMERARRDHQAILDACAAGDAQAAADLTREHIVNAGRTLVAFLKAAGR